jgi:hypothetical protein
MTYLVLNPNKKTKKKVQNKKYQVRKKKTKNYACASRAHASRLAMQVVTHAHYHLIRIITQLGILDYL